MSEVFRSGIALSIDISLGGSHAVGGDGKFEDVSPDMELPESECSNENAGGEGDARSLSAIVGSVLGDDGGRGTSTGASGTTSSAYLTRLELGPVAQ